MFPSLLLGGFLEFSALLFGENFVDAHLGTVHLTRDFNLEFSFAVEEWIEVFGLVTFSFQKVFYAIAHGSLAGAKFVDALAGIVGDGVKFAFLFFSEVTDKLGDIGTLTLTTVISRFLSQHSESKEKGQSEEKYLFHCFIVLIAIIHIHFHSRLRRGTQ